VRVGLGFDAHRLTEGRPLILAGVEVPFALGLAGHSDADVVTHAIMDALLGACSAGDIGSMFPDDDPAYEGASSIALLEEVLRVVVENGFEVTNVDVTVICQEPRLGPFRDSMSSNLARACRVKPGAVSIKATTTEGMGFTGSGEGIAAAAVVLLSPAAGIPT